MAYVANVYQGDHVVATDLQNIENNFEYLRTNFKGGGAPSDPGGGLEGTIWWDSSNKLPKIRSDSGWRGIFSGSSSFKIWAYLDTAEDGWARDSSMADQVLALKGGSVYTTGATYDKGSWTISGISTESEHTHTAPNHNHQIYNWTNINNIKVYNSAGAEIGVTASAGSQLGIVGTVSANGSLINVDMYSAKVAGTTSAGSAHTHTQDGNWRIKASVGIMVYPDI